MKSTGGFSLPSFVEKGKFVLCATDNIDFLKNTPDGQNILQGTIIRAGALVQWLKLLAWKVRDRGFEPHSGLQVSKKQNVSSTLTRKDSILCGNLHDREVACSTLRARISNPVSGGQCHLIHLTILRRFSCPSLSYMCTKVA